MRVLISISPESLEALKEGRKRWEYRKHMWLRTDVDTIVVYCSRPVSRVVGEIHVTDILNLPVRELWRRTADGSGITHDEFRDYFRGRFRGYAIEVSQFTEYDQPKEIGEVIPGAFAPTSEIVYLDK